MLRNLRVALFLAFQSLRRGNKVTIVLICLVVSLAFINLVFASSLINGAIDTINKQVVNTMVSNIVIEPQEEPTREDFIVHPEELQRQIENIPGVVATAPRYKLGGSIAYDKERSGDYKSVSGEIIGIDPEQEKQVTTIAQKVIAGQYLEGLRKDEILLGADLAGDTALNSLGGAQVGDEVRVTFNNGIVREYKVKGIFKTKFEMVDGMAFITTKEAESILSVPIRASQILVKIDETGAEDHYITQIQALAPNLVVREWTDYTGALGDITDSFDIVVYVVYVASLASAAVTMFVMIYVNVVNRRRQIGILKAIGIKQNIIVYSYIIQALFYGILGVCIGLLLFAYLLTPYFELHPFNFPIGEASLSLDGQQLIYAALSLLAAAFVAGLFPSWRAARENILKAIWGT